MSQKESEYSFKIVLVGDPTVGKTSIILRFVDNIFIPDNVTTNGANVKTRDVQFGKKSVKLVLIDTVGQERFRTISRSMYRDADAVIVVYDQGSEKSFVSVRFWLNEVEKYASENIQKLLVSNKSDLSAAVVPLASGRALAEELRIPFFDVSAKADVNIEPLFQQSVQSMGERLHRGEEWSKFKIVKNRNSGSFSAGSSSSSNNNNSGSVGGNANSQRGRKSGFCIIL